MDGLCKIWEEYQRLEEQRPWRKEAKAFVKRSSKKELKIFVEGLGIRSFFTYVCMPWPTIFFLYLCTAGENEMSGLHLETGAFRLRAYLTAKGVRQVVVLDPFDCQAIEPPMWKAKVTLRTGK